MLWFRRSWHTIAIGVIFFLLILGKSAYTLDPDLGWHLQTGQLILNSGIPSHDPFSYTMPSFRYVDHSWLPDILTALLFNLGGLIIPSSIISLIAVGALLLSSEIEHASRWRLFPLIMTGLIFFEFVALRPLVLSWFFLTLLFFICWTEPRWKRYRLVLPALFFIWANCHGGFVSGLLIVFLKVTVEMWTKKSFSLINLCLFAVSIAITLVNPYGVGLWKEVGATLFSSSLRFSIAEWIPGIFSFDPIAGTLAVLSSTLLVRYRRSFSLFQISVFIFTFLSAITTIRNIPLWAIIAVPVTTKGLGLLNIEVQKVKYGPERFVKVYRVFLVVISLFLAITLIQGVYQIASFKESDYYPKNALTYLNNQHLSGNIFAPYGWGGYLIWNYSEKKVFIDGRMPTWQQSEVPFESSNAFFDYHNITTGKNDYKSAFNKFTITTVLWPSSKQTSSEVKQRDNHWENVLVSFGLLEKPVYAGSLLERLQSDNWKKIYDDGNSVIYIQGTP